MRAIDGLHSFLGIPLDEVGCGNNEVLFGIDLFEALYMKLDGEKLWMWSYWNEFFSEKKGGKRIRGKESES